MQNIGEAMKFANVKLYGEDFKFSLADVCVENGVFCDSSDGEIVDCTGLMMIPGLVDVHTHGAIGYEAKDTSPEAIEALSSFEAEHGVTAFLPTTATEGTEELKLAAANIAKAKKTVKGAKIGGIHMEGPYFSMKYKGAQNPEYIRKPNADEFLEINEASGNIVKLISIAPENEGAEEFVKAVKSKVRVAAGHTDADYEIMVKAIEWGITQLTHSFNAMRGLHHRNPGAIGAAIDSNIFCELISDGMHVHPAMVRLFYKAVGAERLVLISDSVRSAYLPDGEYDSCGLKVFVKNGKATLEDGTIAGSSSTLYDCLKQAVSFGIPIEDAVRAATYNPAKSVGIDNEFGTIKKGRSADFLLVDENLNLKAVYIDGKRIK